MQTKEQLSKIPAAKPEKVAGLFIKNDELSQLDKMLADGPYSWVKKVELFFTAVRAERLKDKL